MLHARGGPLEKWPKCWIELWKVDLLQSDMLNALFWRDWARNRSSSAHGVDLVGLEDYKHGLGGQRLGLFDFDAFHRDSTRPMQKKLTGAP